jgi:hypothetical protein
MLAIRVAPQNGSVIEARWLLGKTGRRHVPRAGSSDRHAIMCGVSNPTGGRLCLGLISSNNDALHSSGTKRGPVFEDGELSYCLDDWVNVSRAFPSWKRSILTEIYLCHACSYQEIEDGSARTGALAHAGCARPHR